MKCVSKLYIYRALFHPCDVTRWTPREIETVKYKEANITISQRVVFLSAEKIRQRRA